ncbi:hypothetical protein CHS0354_005519 [Potamilus streckersoni]|uniref:Glycosyl transferase family 1 domain-containing protein n=1 Tax=Potamilus streckersoni TaxID=2493646 RepID=A0AAE0VM49_9BIVA|nr:hypothetical protein CHS0354_005519 [Potamilus streckersoni]
MTVSVLLITPMKSCAGNSTTIQRIISHLEHQNIQCFLHVPGDFSDLHHFQTFLDENKVGLVIGIHAYKSGILLKDCQTPFLLLIGGTDVNELYRDPERFDVMSETLHRAKYTVVFSKYLQDRVLSLWPSLNKNCIRIIPQAVQVEPTDRCLCQYLINNNFPLPRPTEDLKIFLLVGGIREVKDPLYLVRQFSEWSQSKPDYRAIFIIIGPQMDENFQKKFQQEIENLPRVLYIPGLSLGDTHAAIKGSSVLVNSSLSEGMPIAILEAMLLGTPVLARRIPGNETVVEDGHTGLLFESPQDFIKKAEQLLNDEALRWRLQAEALEYVRREHCCEKEAKMYLSLLEEIVEDNQLSQQENHT